MGELCPGISPSAWVLIDEYEDAPQGVSHRDGKEPATQVKCPVAVVSTGQVGTRGRPEELGLYQYRGATEGFEAK